MSTSIQSHQARFGIRQRTGIGFTLIEVLVVTAIAAIAAAVVVPQMLQVGSLGVQAATRMIIADLLYAQNDAITNQADRRVVFEPNLDRYRLTDAENNTLSVSWRGGGDVGNNYVVDLIQDSRFRGVTLQAADFGGDATIEFDDLGTPTNGGSVVLSGGNAQYRINVTPFTGRISVELAGE